MILVRGFHGKDKGSCSEFSGTQKGKVKKCSIALNMNLKNVVVI